MTAATTMERPMQAKGHQKMRFLLKVGMYYADLPFPEKTVGPNNQPQEYRAGDVVESHEDLVAKFGEKFERIDFAARQGYGTLFTDSGQVKAEETEDQYLDRMRQKYRQDKAPANAAASIVQAKAAPGSLVGTLEAMDVAALQRMAQDNGIDVRQAKGRKADVVAILSAGLMSQGKA